MKKFILGLSCGLLISCSSVALASGTIQVLLFPASFEINGTTIAINKDYKVLNVDGHAYVPIRFVTENLGGVIEYDTDSKKVIVKNKPLDLTDPFYKGVSVGNLILTKAGKNTKITGQLVMVGVGSTKNKLEANLAFYNVQNKKVGEIVIRGNDFGVEPRTFTVEAPGDFRKYETALLRIRAVNDQIISKVPTILYKNAEYMFTLELPKRWEGKYEVVHGTAATESFQFINIANKAYGGLQFTIDVFPKEKWVLLSKADAQNARMSMIGEKAGKIFTISTPSDVQNNTQDEKLEAEYRAMYSDINRIKTTFKSTD
jgi:hypothetical protein